MDTHPEFEVHPVKLFLLFLRFVATKVIPWWFYPLAAVAVVVAVITFYAVKGM